MVIWRIIAQRIDHQEAVEVSSVSVFYSKPVAFHLLIIIVSMQREPIPQTLNPKIEVGLCFLQILLRRNLISSPFV